MKILVTGGAGFIGQRLVARLVEAGDAVTVLDSLIPQVHGQEATFDQLDRNVECVHGDIRDRPLLEKVVKVGFDVVYHLASLTGVGQSMYNIEEYVDVNCRGTATLLEALTGAGVPRPHKIILASSRAVYGEGHQRCTVCEVEFYPKTRSESQLSLPDPNWEHGCPKCGSESQPLPTLESAPLQPTSIYAMSKVAQEQLCNIVGDAYDVPVTIFRYFNVYGPGQSMSNPYTGILSIFSRRFMNGQNVEVYEDGLESRDFVYVDDVVQANLLASKQEASGVFNICSGKATTVYEVAQLLAQFSGRSEESIIINGKYRVGDIRHGLGSWERAGKLLEYRPKYDLQSGLEQLSIWLAEQPLSQQIDSDQIAQEELKSRGLFR